MADCCCDRTEAAQNAGPSPHDAESLRHVTSIECLFCPHYDVDTLVNGVERFISSHSSNPIADYWKRLVLNPAAIRRVFTAIGTCQNASFHADYGYYRDQYVCFFVATRFYPTYLTWHTPPAAKEECSRRPSSPEKASEGAAKRERSASSPPEKANWWDVNVTKGQRPITFTYPWTELSTDEWREAFLGLYSALWQSTRLDPVLAGFLLKMTKLYIVKAPVFNLLSRLNHAHESWSARLLFHAYHEDVGVLVHGLVRIGYEADRTFSYSLLTGLLASIGCAYDFKAARGDAHGMTQARMASHSAVLHGLLVGSLPDSFTYLQRGARHSTSFEPNTAYMQRVMDAPLELRTWVLATVLSAPVLPLLGPLLDISIDEIVFWNVHEDVAMNPTPTGRRQPQWELTQRVVFVLDVVTAVLEEAAATQTPLPDGVVGHLRQLVPMLATLVHLERLHRQISYLAKQASFSDSEDDSDEEARLSSRCASVTSPLKRNWAGAVDCTPLASTYLLLHVLPALRVMIALELWDVVLAEHDVVAAVLALFERHPTANLLHHALTTLLLALLERPNGKANNVLLRSAFRDDALLRLIERGLAAKVPFRGHMALLGVRLHQICSGPTLAQELVRQYCQKRAAWPDTVSQLVAEHYKQADAVGNRRRLDSFGSSANIVDKTAVSADEVVKSRANSSHAAFPIADADLAALDDAVSDDADVVVGQVFQQAPSGQWARATLTLHKETCSLRTTTDKPAKLRLFSRGKPTGFSMVACHVSEWIVYAKHPAAFGLQVVGFDTIKELDVTLTFVVPTKAVRDAWLRAITSAIHVVTRGADFSEEAHLRAVEALLEGYPNAFLVRMPTCRSDFVLQCEVPEDVPFWGKYVGPSGVAKFRAIVDAAVAARVATPPTLETIGHAVFAEYSVAFVTAAGTCDCICRDIYTLERGAVAGLTRTLVGAEKLVAILLE
ncbi:hypothetical protein ACHHYP_08281 [Achlya hypogyna]|uniref:PH domain-containing protein n=1 Tax=Achlya hypogyna TaxID=1202772 RepID=A0A1V9ZL38_ACHHY|nr:hypothetical protein ACHHYP_08281 [Achlya hypogyna]